MPATADRDAQRKDSDVQSYKVGAVKIYKGTLVSLRNDGYVYPSRSGTSTDKFVGVADEQVDNAAGAAGDKEIRVRKTGTYVFAKASAVITDLDDPMYASDDQTLTATSTNNQLVGYVQRLESSSTLRIRIDNAVQ